MEFYLLGIVRNVDPIRQVLYVLTPLSLEALQRVNTLLKGNLEIPAALLLSTKQVNGPYISTEFTYELYGAMAKKQRPFQIRRHRVLWWRKIILFMFCLCWETIGFNMKRTEQNWYLMSKIFVVKCTLSEQALLSERMSTPWRPTESSGRLGNCFACKFGHWRSECLQSSHFSIRRNCRS